MDKDTIFSHTSTLAYEIFTIKGDFTVSSFIPATAELNKLIEGDVIKHLVVDLSEVNFIDSKGIHLLINLKKKVESHNKKIFLLKPSESVASILEDTELKKVFEVIETCETLDQQAAIEEYKALLPYSFEDNGLRRLNCSCFICGSRQVIAYLMDDSSMHWDWMYNDPFPLSLDNTTNEKIDFFSLLPKVCLGCYMTSLNIRHFNVLSENGSIIVKSTLKDESKALLAKSIKRRKKIISPFHDEEEKIFFTPRERDLVFKLFELAEFCVRTISVIKTDVTLFDIGYLNYLIIKYAEQEEKEPYINNCRTWFTQALTNEEHLTISEYAISHFVLLISDLSLRKVKEASQTLTNFTNFVENLPSTIATDGFSSPHFWYKQAEAFWQKEIDDQSNAMKV